MTTETIGELAAEKRATPPRPKGRPAGSTKKGKPADIPVGAIPADGAGPDGEPTIKLDPRKLQVVVDHWLAAMADVPCRILGTDPLTRKEAEGVVHATEGLIEAYFPALTAGGALYTWILVIGTTYGTKWMEAQQKREAILSRPPPTPPENHDRGEVRMGQNGPQPTAFPGH